MEKLGIEKSLESIKKADIVLFIHDASEKESEEEKEIAKKLKNKKIINVVNKIDKKRILAKLKDEVEISALEEKNINLLKNRIVSDVVSIDLNTFVLTNERHIQILKSADKLMKEVLLLKEESLDVIAMLLKKVWAELGKITGNTENEDIISLIFSKFCLGK